MITILMTRGALIVILENIYSTGVTHDDYITRIKIFLQYRPLVVELCHFLNYLTDEI
jgi:hypothetical protein